MKALALLSIFLTLPAMAQTAKVIILPKDIADEARAAYAQKAEADKRIAAVEARAYALVPHQDTFWAWSQGVQFSDDFIAIVPKTGVVQPQGYFSIDGKPSTWGCSNPVVNPVHGIVAGDLVTLPPAGGPQ